ncbi:MmcQ/YjbR family DNA-binding protein [Streptacidiphilus carbonis]|uniref:MmcQ/YjbR family DNA-binding protein n=1 Tax=Streptacidiphilus carbonis TaxID=105422 RepID=UPI0005AA171E|nr:MmcQ/YjbR family DNA-binding protein [Streptacidiphilus carbonis]
MADWDDVRRLALALPGTSEVVSRGTASWRVKDRGFVWERPLRKTDLEALGDKAPQGPIVAARVADLGVRQALIAGDPAVYFTIPHFDGFPAVLALLDRIDVTELGELIVEAWLDRAPKRLAAEYRDQSP